MVRGDLVRVRCPAHLLRAHDSDNDYRDDSLYDPPLVTEGLVVVLRDDARDGYVIVIHPVHGVGSLYHTVLEVVQCSIS